jgi:CDP-glucose 4,6-dehydratase
MDRLINLRGKRVLVTGHTGFKGVWLSLFLKELGCEVHGISLPPESSPNLFEETKLDKVIASSSYLDITNTKDLEHYFLNKEFDLIFHLAAQSLVSRGYEDPVGTFKTNVIGTVNLMVLASKLNNLSGLIMITTDKVYENKEWCWPYRERDTLGGSESYGGSKAASEIAIKSLSYLFDGKQISVVTCRAGNVIGGGDWSENRLVPDIIRSLNKGGQLKLRHPEATRPWQHVLDCLYGYLLTGSAALNQTIDRLCSFNFGPDSSLTVLELINSMESYLGPIPVEKGSSIGKEHFELSLDSSKSRKILGWSPKYDSKSAIAETAKWYSHFEKSGNAYELIQDSIERYLKIDK